MDRPLGTRGPTGGQKGRKVRITTRHLSTRQSFICQAYIWWNHWNDSLSSFQTLSGRRTTWGSSSVRTVLVSTGRLGHTSPRSNPSNSTTGRMTKSGYVTLLQQKFLLVLSNFIWIKLLSWPKVVFASKNPTLSGLAGGGFSVVFNRLKLSR